MHLKVKCLILQSLIVRQTAMMETAQPPTVGVCSSNDDDDHHNHNYHIKTIMIMIIGIAGLLD